MIYCKIIDLRFINIKYSLKNNNFTEKVMFFNFTFSKSFCKLFYVFLIAAKWRRKNGRCGRRHFFCREMKSFFSPIIVVP